MRRLVLMAIFCSGVFYAPLPLIAQNGGGSTPLIPVADMPDASGGATASSDPPLEVDADAVPELVPPRQVGGGAEAPSRTSAPAAAPAPDPAPEPAPAPAAEPTASVAVPDPEPEPAEPAQDEPVGEVPNPDDEEPTDTPTTPEPEEQGRNEEEFEEEFDNVPEPSEPNAPGVAPQATAGPQLPRTGADLPALLLSGLALTASGMSLRALSRERS